MKIGVFGSGDVGRTLATKFVQLGHDVMMGSRTAKSEGVEKWLKSVGSIGGSGTFADAATFGELLFNCTNGANSLAALRLAGATPMRNKTLVDAANPLDFSQGMPATLTVCNTDSLGEQIQREFPETNVVKALNTVNCEIMVTPALVPGEHQLFICGNSLAAKQDVADKISQWFGWTRGNIVDIGDIEAARATEMYLPLWLTLMVKLGTPRFNVQINLGKKT